MTELSAGWGAVPEVGERGGHERPVGAGPTSTLPVPSTATHSSSEGHETPVSQAPGSTAVVVQAVAPPVGFVEVATFPRSPDPMWASSTTHSDTVGQADRPRPWPLVSTSVAVQAEAPPVGSVEVSACPAKDATHSDSTRRHAGPGRDGGVHRSRGPGRGAAGGVGGGQRVSRVVIGDAQRGRRARDPADHRSPVDVRAGPGAGPAGWLAEVTTLPTWSIATPSVVDAHVTSSSCVEPSTSAVVQAAEP